MDFTASVYKHRTTYYEYLDILGSQIYQLFALRDQLSQNANIANWELRDSFLRLHENKLQDDLQVDRL